jgi:hypothetical protein
MFLTCGWLYGKGKKILQQAAGKLRSQALSKVSDQGRKDIKKFSVFRCSHRCAERGRTKFRI